MKALKDQFNLSENQNNKEVVKMEDKNELTLEILNESLGKIAEEVEAIKAKRGNSTQPSSVSSVVEEGTKLEKGYLNSAQEKTVRDLREHYEVVPYPPPSKTVGVFFGTALSKVKVDIREDGEIMNAWRYTLPRLREEDTQLEEQVAELQEKADTYDKLSSLLKSPENFIEFAAHFGYDNLIPPATEAEVAEAEAHEEEAGEEGESVILTGKVDREGYEYLPNLDISILK